MKKCELCKKEKGYEFIYNGIEVIACPECISKKLMRGRENDKKRKV